MAPIIWKNERTAKDSIDGKVATTVKICNGDKAKNTFDSERSLEVGVKMTKETVKEVMSVFSKKFQTKIRSELDGLSIAKEYADAITLASQLPKEQRPESFNSFHQNCASHLINVFYHVPMNEFKTLVEYAQSRVNVQLLQYALSVALIHRDEVLEANIQLPSHTCIQPNMYFDINKLKNSLDNQKYIRIEDGKRLKTLITINDNFTATNLDPEHKVAYFREDIGLNLHHRHWHEVYPFEGLEIIVNKDRRGELFYYMHQQILARYNFERFSNHLPRVEPYDNFEKPIKEAYFPKFDAMSSSTDISSRPSNTILKDLHRETHYTKLSTMERWRDRIYEAIDRGYAYTRDPVTKEEVSKKIDEETGIDELGNTIEAADLSWNRQYYGNLHNSGHLFFGYAHDPDHRFKENSGVMAFAETALRDPIFYRWHAHINDIFQHYKRTLPPYTAEQKQFKGIDINSVEILSQEIKQGENNNILKTFWEKDVVEVTHGIPQDPNKPPNKEQIFAVFTHLQHEQFEYEIKVKNDLSCPKIGTVRIYLAPHLDESAQQMPFNGQRQLFMEMDKFTAKLDPCAITTIKRKSTESSVTIPFKKTFMSYKDTRKIVKHPELNEELLKAMNGYCSCGWPQHLLVGKGTPGDGLKCDLFVMITDYEDDKVEESPLEQKCCEKSSLSYCGVRNNKYPDRKAMGFPFDRDITEATATIEDFMTEKREDWNKNAPSRFSNMMIVPVLVRHEEGPAKRGQSLRDLGCTEEIFENITSLQN